MWTGFWSFVRHKWAGNWTVRDPSTPHIGTLDLTHKILIFGLHVSLLDTHVLADQVEVHLLATDKT